MSYILRSLSINVVKVQTISRLDCTSSNIIQYIRSLKKRKIDDMDSQESYHVQFDALTDEVLTQNNQHAYCIT